METVQIAHHEDPFVEIIPFFLQWYEKEEKGEERDGWYSNHHYHRYSWKTCQLGGIKIWKSETLDDQSNQPVSQ